MRSMCACVVHVCVLCGVCACVCGVWCVVHVHVCGFICIYGACVICGVCVCVV